MERAAVRGQQTFERLHLLARLRVDDAPEPRLGEPPAAVQERGASFRIEAGLHLVPDVGAQTMAFEGVELERLLVFEGLIVELEPHAEPLAQEEPGGVGEEGDQIAEIDAAPGRVRLRQRHAGEAGRGFGGPRPRPHDLRRLAHPAGVAEQPPGARAGRLEVPLGLNGWRG